MGPYLRLVRPVNLAMVFATIAAAAILGKPDLSHWWLIFVSAIAGTLIAAGGYAINDYFDVEIDAVNRPDRPLPSGAVSRAGAWWAWRLNSSAGVILSAFVGPINFAIAVFWVVALFFYGRVLKRTILWGNLVVGVATGLAFVHGCAAVGSPERSVVPAVFAFLINVARELVKDAEDVRGDRADNAGTLAVRHGVRSALALASLVLVLLMTSTLLPYSAGLYNDTYLGLVLVVDAALVFVLISMWRNSSSRNLSRLSLVLKSSMALGLVAIFFGS